MNPLDANDLQELQSLLGDNPVDPANAGNGSANGESAEPGNAHDQAPANDASNGNGNGNGNDPAFPNAEAAFSSADWHGNPENEFENDGAPSPTPSSEHGDALKRTFSDWWSQANQVVREAQQLQSGLGDFETFLDARLADQRRDRDSWHAEKCHLEAQLARMKSENSDLRTRLDSMKRFAGEFRKMLE